MEITEEKKRYLGTESVLEKESLFQDDEAVKWFSKDKWDAYTENV